MPRIELEVAADLPQGFVVDKVVVLVEGIYPNGEATLWTTCSEGMMSWQSLGITRAAMLRDEYNLNASYISEDERDE